MSVSSKEFGKEGEDLAAGLLNKKGYKILKRNFHFGRVGEIDIIAADPADGFLVFVEVKSRKNLEFGDPVLAITKNKMMQLKKVAAGYLYVNNITEIDCRFDVITVLKREKRSPEIKHYVNAFT